MKYYIEINEQHRKVFEVEAESEDDAVSRVEAAYDTGTITAANAETVYIAYNAVRNGQEIEKIRNCGSFSVLPDRPVTYTADYTLTLTISDTESKDISCKVEGYTSMEEAKDDSTSVIAEFLFDHNLSDGTYTFDVGYYSCSGDEEPIYTDGALIKVLYQSDSILYEEKIF